LDNDGCVVVVHKPNALQHTSRDDHKENSENENDN
jgi:hypothetical protein